MRREERIFRDLCIEIARDRLQGDRFTALLMETGLVLDEHEWEVANKLLGKSDELMSMIPEEFSTSPQ
ncbi:MAG: hypothetical protein HY073_04960 [Deltaproteobacteria bacterium]|nr:hypothetical protein [Deltaproteobacteria bacterium]